MTLTNLQRDRGMCISFFVTTNVASTSPKYELGKVAFQLMFQNTTFHATVKTNVL